ncbi:MAG: DUF11 domain-containing protein, partial [Deltaproteobacteria bacterium]|nr:DUF11 domain-containing protein [Deltaproteobacteria bacterium]
MDKVKSFPGVFWILGLSVFLCSVSVLAFAADQPVPDKLMLSNAVFQEVEVVNADGKKEIKRVPADTALPGSELIYVITYKNSSDKPAEDVVINNPLAKELLYKDKSASGENAVVSVSVDGGKHYGDLAILRIPTTEGASRPAEVSDITDLQFKLSKQVLPQ